MTHIDTQQIGRNVPCPCGSGKKYKQCCGELALGPVQYCNRGYTLLTQGRLDDAVASFRKALAIQPDFAEAYNDLGIALHAQEKLDEAVATFRRALSFRPDYAEANNNLGFALVELDLLDDAIASYRNALSLKPDFVAAHSNLGNALRTQGKLDEAIASHHHALAIKPDYAEGHYDLALALRDQGKRDEAVASFRMAISLKPEFARAHLNLGVILQELSRFEDAIASYRKALSCEPDFAEAHSNLLFAMQFCPIESSSRLTDEYKRFAAQFEAPLKTGWRRHQNTREPERRVKVGYVSPDFRRHAVASFIEPPLAHHDKDRFEVFCYYNNTPHDEYTRRIGGHADRWLDCENMSDAQLAERIRADGIDILVDLAGHTAHNRIMTFARKPAPVQITYLGYPGTSGLSAMDYRLTDGRADPPGSEENYTEKLLRLPDSLCCYRPGQDMPAVTALPAQQNGYVTFGSFNSFNKVSDPCIELWARVMRAVPGSRLLMVTVPPGEPRQRITRQFALHGVSAERLDFCGSLAQGEFFRTFLRADIALDPFPVTGGTTTCESLWMGLPVIVLIGARFISRVGFSFLSTAGMAEFAAETAERYVEVASKLAGDLPQLAARRARLRPQMAASPLVDEVRFTRNLEKIYREVWAQWCDTVS